MKRVNQVNDAPLVTKGNVFGDLGFSTEEARTLEIKSDLWRVIVDHIESGEYTQADLARKLKIHQPDVSNILNGKISKFSLAKLFQLAMRLDLEPKVIFGETAKRSTPVSKRRLVHA